MPLHDRTGVDHEFSNNAPIFRGQFENGEYRQETGDGWQFSRPELGTFSNAVERVAERGHARLKEAVGEVGGLYEAELGASPYTRTLDLLRFWRAPASPGDYHQQAITSYSRDSAYSHATTRMQKSIPYFEQRAGRTPFPSVCEDAREGSVRRAVAGYEAMLKSRPEYETYWSRDRGAQETVLRIERALSAMPALDASRSSAQDFNPGTPYRGNMVFRGAEAKDIETGKPIYVPDGEAAPSTGGLRKGDYVTNTDLMSTSAVAAVAGEFIMRQKLKDPTYLPKPGDPPKYVTGKNQADHDGRRVLFTIDHQSGRPIAHYSQETQAEVLFSRGAVFEIKAIDKSDYGTIVRLEEKPGCWKSNGDFEGIPGQPEAKIHNMMTGREVPRIDVFWPKGTVVPNAG